jgi:hypothetical protein
MGHDINTVAVHEAGHAVVLASLGHANRIENSQHYGLTVPNTDTRAGYVATDGPLLLPVETECPYYLGGAIAQKRFAPDATFKMRNGNLNGDIESLVASLNEAGHSAYFEDVYSEVHCLLFGEPSLHARMLTALSGAEGKPAPWDDILCTGYRLAEEKLRTHWNTVRELADCLIARGILGQADLLPLFKRYGLSST